MTLGFSGCDLHIPYKRWGDDPQEEQNYEAIEQWALRFRTHCLPKAGGGGVTAHQATYLATSFYHSGVHPVTPSTVFYGDGTNHSPDWETASVSDTVAPSVFTPGHSGGATYIGVGAVGFLSWTGQTLTQLPSTTAVGDTYWNVYDYDAVTDLDVHQEDTNNAFGATESHRMAVSGSMYIPSGFKWSLVMRQSSTIDGTGGGAITLTLLEF